jgi:hypothetical protein
VRQLGADVKIDVRGKTVLMVGRVGDLHCDPVGKATTTCRECGHVCSIAPASIERLRVQPAIVVLCIECAMAANEIESFSEMRRVSNEELAEATRRSPDLF